MGQIFSSFRRNQASVVNVNEDEEGCDTQRFSNQIGCLFASNFLLGGERYDAPKPEAFLFGENHDLDLLGTKPAQFPYSKQPITDPVRTLNAFVNLRRDSLKIIKRRVEDDEDGSDEYSVEFYFDCDIACYVQIHFFCKQVVSSGQVTFVSKKPQIKSTNQYFFDVGAEQLFNKFTFDKEVHDLANMHYGGGAYFPIIIELHTVDCDMEQVQTTMASIDRSTDQSMFFVLKALKQKLVADGVVYLLQEIYGIENKEHDYGEENGSECIICMSDIRDTMILPCRHLCICNACAETLRYKLNNCPICRAPFRALLQLKTMRVVSTVSITDQTSSVQQTRSQTKYETMTLIEALNGPISHSQCVVPSGPLCDDDPAVSFIYTNKAHSGNCANVQQVLTLIKPPTTDENAVYIEMKAPTDYVITQSDSNKDSGTQTVRRNSSSSSLSPSH